MSPTFSVVFLITKLTFQITKVPSPPTVIWSVVKHLWSKRQNRDRNIVKSKGLRFDKPKCSKPFKSFNITGKMFLPGIGGGVVSTVILRTFWNHINKWWTPTCIRETMRYAGSSIYSPPGRDTCTSFEHAPVVLTLTCRLLCPRTCGRGEWVRFVVRVGDTGLECNWDDNRSVDY